MNRIKETMAEKHVFALYIESLSLLLKNSALHAKFTLVDEQLFHRVITVLRLQVEDTCILFDQITHVTCIFIGFTGKKQLHFKIVTRQANKIYTPEIIFLLPVLKRDDYEGALYSLTELGVNTIQLVFTQKTGQHWDAVRDGERARRIMIAAAEQSKNFAFPELKAPISFERVVHEYSSAEKKIFFDPQGEQCFSVMEALHKKRPKEVLLLIGPEGDLTAQEKKVVEEKGFIFCALTPTIIRAVQAAAFGAGFVRSIV